MSETIRSEWQGSIFGGPRYRDGFGLLTNRSTNTTALVSTPFITEATFATLRGTGNTSIQVVNPATGYLDLGPVDEIAISCGGSDTNNETVNYMVEALYPCYSVLDTGKSTRLGLAAVPVAVGLFTLSSAMTLSAAGVAALPTTGTALLTTDMLADTVTNSISGTPNSLVIVPGTDNGVAQLIVKAPGAIGLVLRTDIGTAVDAFLYGQRRQGNALRLN